MELVSSEWRMSSNIVMIGMNNELNEVHFEIFLTR